MFGCVLNSGCIQIQDMYCIMYLWFTVIFHKPLVLPEAWTAGLGEGLLYFLPKLAGGA